MRFLIRTKVFCLSFLVIVLLLGASGVGGGNGGGGRVTVPLPPTGLKAIAGNAWVSLMWNLSPGATSYLVKRSTTSGGPYTPIGAPTATEYTDTRVTNGTTYFYVVAALNSAGESANSAQVSAKPTAPPLAAPTGLTTSAGNAQVSLAWYASTGATSYHLKRSATSGGPYTQIAAPTDTSYTDTGLTNGKPYFYVVSAVDSAGESANSTQASATPVLTTTEVQVSVDTLVDRHPISPYVYGGNFPQDAAHVTDSGMTVVRWGGDSTSAYNWQTHTQNIGNDWYFEDLPMSGFNNGSDSDSTQWIRDVIAAGSNPLMTMPMLDWVSVATMAEAEASGEIHSFSVKKYGAQCATDPYDPDAGDGVKTDCVTDITGNDPRDANVPLLDTSSSPCPSSGCAGSVYRDTWAAALATAFNTSPNALHFYDMDNEPDLWDSTHRDIHPNPTSYEELRDTFLTEARNLKGWDPAAVRLGPIGCCWWFYWNGANNSDKAAHGMNDLFPWFLNEVYWHDRIDNTRSLDVFDVHAYPDGPNTSGWTPAQNQALSLRIYRDYWDPTYVSEAVGDIDSIWPTSIQPLSTIPFRIPRLRAMINMIYPNTPLSFTEWSANFAGESDFSTALADADAYGIIGRERLYLASRWAAPSPANPNYQALKLYRNYDGKHSTFGTMSISATHNADPDLFSVYASLSPSGTQLKLLVINKDPYNAAQVTFDLNNFTASAFQSYMLSQASPKSIVASASGPGCATQTFPPYSATLIVVAGSLSITPAAEWDLNPDAIQMPAGGSVNLAPKLLSGKSVTLTSARFDSEGIGTISISQPEITTVENGAISIEAGGTAGFYHFTVTSRDGSGASQTQGGWVLIGNPSASLTNNATPASGAAGKQVTLSVTLNPGYSVSYPDCFSPPCGPTSAAGASVLFTVSAGSLSGGVYPVTSTSSTMQQIAVVDTSGNASVTLKLPATSGPVNVTAEGPYALGHPVLPLTVTVP